MLKPEAAMAAECAPAELEDEGTAAANADVEVVAVAGK